MIRATLLVGGAALALAVGWSRAREDPPRDDRVARLLEERDRLRAELEAARAREEDLRREATRLRAELGEAGERRTAREREWLEFTRAIASLPVPEETSVPLAPGFLPEPDPEAAAEVDPAAERAARRRRARAEEVRTELNALLVAEHVFALDVLELGAVNEGWAGPVVVRLLDDRGRLTGTLAADRLRLEASRAGRSVTLVFEVGWESHGGVRVPFGAPEEEGSERGGTRRVHLPGVDPAPWIEVVPELLRPEDLRPTPDDGRWNLVELRLVLDGRLRADSPGGRWRLVSLGGVVGGELLEVHLAEQGPDGRVVRRLFADSMRIRRHGRGLRLVLEDGVIERDGEKAPFLDGRYRLYLADASPERWAEEGVPGLSPPPR